MTVATFETYGATLSLDEEDFDLDIRISSFGDATGDKDPMFSGAGTCPTCGSCTCGTCNQSACDECGPTLSNCHGC
ncbi:hypothetical protein EPA93_46935 [Ktedonosporobacter rubrisoli]|uniref:Uncharacterized protein n=1 Tax=Ktedonosporobacter rubrisoli TaxID=2509675 RepID=A0A4P6K549_KTERU|nr:hypothetical protein [Ktedonosporobacter rubrisoli]QBD83102.1 hypothetical protein EPA93_46935 [Ktedonosporobacter rubrisoli]